MGAGLGEVHEQIFSVGEEEARQLTGSKAERFCHDIATGILRDDKFDLSILHSGFAVTALPHRATQAQVWTRTGGKNGELTLEVQSGRFNGESLGIPYGPSARLILIYLCSEAVTNKSRVVELGASMGAFLRRMGVGAGGKTRSIFRDQSRRLSACRLTFFYRRAHDTVISNGSFVRNAVFVNAGGPHDQSSLWSDTVELDEAFYKSLTDHPLPLREAAIRQLSGRSMALDVYVFLSYRLHALEKAVLVPWPALYQQFGGGFNSQPAFRQAFKETIKLSLAAYPEARVEMDGDNRGLVLHPSPSPVPKIHPMSTRLRLI